MEPITLILVTLILSAFFSGMEIAFITSSKLKIELDKNKGLWSGRVLSDLGKNPSRFISALLLGNNIALVIYGIAMSDLLTPLLRMYISQSDSIVLIVQTIIATLIILLVAEFLPKVLFRINPNGALRILFFPAIFFYFLLFPLNYLFVGFATFLMKHVFRFSFKHEPYSISVVDLDEYIREFTTPATDDEAEIEQEIQIFQNAIEFHDLLVRECMIPRTEIKAMEENESIETLKALFTTTGHSRILIYKERIDFITGYVHAFNLFGQPRDISSILMPVEIIPETMPARKALEILLEQHRGLAVVVDEFGGTSGLVTTEDLIEEIIGEISDEHDKESLTERKLNNQEYIFSGRMEIDYLNDKYRLGLPESENYETLAGLVIHYHESIPEQGESILKEPYTFTILQASENRIDKIHLKIGT